MDVKYPDVEVQLTGTDSNVFAIIGTVSRAIRRAHGAEAATEFTNEATNCESYDDVLVLAMRTVEVS